MPFVSQTSLIQIVIGSPRRNLLVAASVALGNSGAIDDDPFSDLTASDRMRAT
jgi:hypothetical protein